MFNLCILNYDILKTGTNHKNLLNSIPPLNTHNKLRLIKALSYICIFLYENDQNFCRKQIGAFWYRLDRPYRSLRCTLNGPMAKLATLEP